MISSQIEKMRKNLLNSKEEIDINLIFATILKNIEKNKLLINKCFLSETGYEMDFDMIKNIFVLDKSNNYGNINSPFINNYGRVSSNMIPYGIVGAVIDKNIKLKNYLELIKVCLETRNSLIIKPFRLSATLELFIKIINDVLSQTKDFNNIILTGENLLTKDLDLLVFIGKKEVFNTLNTSLPKIFVGTLEYELFVHEFLDDNLIDFAKANGIKVFYDEENVYEKINVEGSNYCTAIMSSDKEKIREFMLNIKSSFILVNMSPALVDTLNLFPEQLLTRKTTIIFDSSSRQK